MKTQQIGKNQVRYLHSTAEVDPVSSPTPLTCPGGTKKQNHKSSNAAQHKSPKAETWTTKTPCKTI